MPGPEGGSRTRVAVIVALVGSVAFGGVLGYLAWTNNSFPSESRPFGDYAQVVSGAFNGTEYSIKLRWLSSGYLPLYAQLRSDATDAANTPVCDLRYSSVSQGQEVDLPFAVAKPTAALSSVDLFLAVRDLGTGAQFTIVYHWDQVDRQQGDVMPTDVLCQQGAAPT
ncbi:MAG: hypothetical protein HY247_04270 [archaeon]|nr:MAG: hypothetical protein HY247_04270 [archaeon]